eukprot:g41794.t1
MASCSADRAHAPSSSSASSSSRVGRQKTAPSSTSASSFATVALQKKAPSSTSASSFATVALQKKAASSRTSRSAPDNLSQAKRADISSQPWLCDQKTLLVSVLTKYPFLDNKSKAEKQGFHLYRHGPETVEREDHSQASIDSPFGKMAAEAMPIPKTLIAHDQTNVFIDKSDGMPIRDSTTELTASSSSSIPLLPR